MDAAGPPTGETGTSSARLVRRLADGHALIGFDAKTPFLRKARHAFPEWMREAFSLHSDSDLAQLALLRAGIGWHLPSVAGCTRRQPAPRAAPRFRLPAGDLRASRRCRVVFDALVAVPARPCGQDAGDTGSRRRRRRRARRMMPIRCPGRNVVPSPGKHHQPRCCFSQASICGRRCARSLTRVWMPVTAVCASRRELSAMYFSAKAWILSAISGLLEPAPSIG